MHQCTSSFARIPILGMEWLSVKNPTKLHCKCSRWTAIRCIKDSYYKQRIEYPSQRYLGAELKGLSKIKYIPSENKFIIKGIASYGGGNKYTKWQLTAATAAVDYAHHKLERAGYIDFDNL